MGRGISQMECLGGDTFPEQRGVSQLVLHTTELHYKRDPRA